MLIKRQEITLSRRRPLFGEALEVRRLLSSHSVMISEILAINDSILADEDGHFSDWIELYNTTSEAIPLQGWTLSDNQDELSKWSLPAVTIDPKGYLLVLASGKDRQDPAAELHTNFRLSGEGEYVALAQPDGSLVHDFVFPRQSPDVSFGFAFESVPLYEATPVDYLVPSSEDASIGSNWTLPEFDDRNWNSASEPIGFDRVAPVVNAGFEREDLDPWLSHGDLEAVTSEIGIQPTEGSTQLVMTTDGQSRFSTEVFLNAQFRGLDNLGNGQVVRASATKRDFTVAAGDRITFDWNFVTSETQYKDFAFVSIDPGLPLQILGDADDPGPLVPSDSRFLQESGFQEFAHRFPDAGTYTLSFGIAKQGSRSSESALIVDNVLIDGEGDQLVPYHQVIQTDIASEMFDVNQSFWMRREFQVDDPNDFESLRFRIKYDDGFAAFLNGQPLARDNAPDELAWNSSALSGRSNHDAMESDDFATGISNLRAGTNTLAVQVLNRDVDDGDLLVATQLLGLENSATTPTLLPTVTPGAPNDSDAIGVAELVEFSHSHGFYDEPFLLELATKSEGTIRYTTDGSAPTISNGETYTQPLTVESTTVVRAVQIDQDTSSRIVTGSYFFLDDVLTQSKNSGRDAGFPNFDFEMDPDIIGQNGTDRFGGKYAATVRDDLLAIPTIALTMNVDDLFGRRGIYANPFGKGPQWERPTSVELIYPDGRAGFQVDAAIKIQGGVSRSNADKKSFRIQFKRQYGPTTLKFPLLGPAAPDEFDSLTLRSSSGEHLVGIHYIRDEFVRQSQIATGHPGAHGTFVHLYINGLYWGLYNPTERTDDAFAATYFGGDKEEYDVIQQMGVSSGNARSWNELNSLSQRIRTARSQESKTALFWEAQGRSPDGTPNPEFANLLDVDNFIDYLIVQIYAGNRDWPGNNFVAARRQGEASTGFKFFVWDAEFVLDQGGLLSFSGVRDGVAQILPGFLTSDAFRVRLSDRIHKHFSPGGAFYVNPIQPEWNPLSPQDNVPAARYAALVEAVRRPLVPETARWGDERALRPQLFTRDEDWQVKVDELLNIYFPQQSQRFLSRNRQYYRQPPDFVTPEGKVERGSIVEIDSRDPVYFTLDGSDPMLPDGSVAPHAILYDTGIGMDRRTTITARRLDGDDWSSAATATYLTDDQPASRENLRISEVNYHPHDALAEFGERKEKSSQFEFIELTNFGHASVDMTGVSLIKEWRLGVGFTFGNQSLRPGESIVIPNDRSTFVSRYGPDIVLSRGVGPFVSDWEFTGSLGDSGDTLTVVNANGQLIQQFTYSDDSKWPGRADGSGSSLEVIDFHADYKVPENWRSSSEFGGNPGTIGSGSDNHIVVNEVFFDSESPGTGKIELHNTSAEAIDIGNWLISDNNKDFIRFRFPAGTWIPQGGYLTVDERMLGFDVEQGDVWLLESTANGRPKKFVDHAEFPIAIDSTSIGRWPNASGRLTPMRSHSFGIANSGPSGDFNLDDQVSGSDLDLMCQAIEDHKHPIYDANNDGFVNQADLDFLVEKILRSNYGDANLDGVFNSRDLVNVFIAAEYDDQVEQNSTWSTGDWNCDREFDSADLVKVFQSGGYQTSAQAGRKIRSDFQVAAALVFDPWDRDSRKSQK